MASLKSVLAVGIGATLAACSNRLIDESQIEASIKEQMAKDGVYAHEVKCPSGLSAKEGLTLVCVVHIRDQQYERIGTLRNVRAHDFDVDFAWARGEAIASAKLVARMAPEVTAKISAPVTIDCGEPLRFLAPDRTVTCDATVGAVHTKLTTTLDAELRPAHWKLDAANLDGATVAP